MELKFEVYGKIARPVADVFRALTDPGQLSAYFTTGGAKGELREGATVLWNFADFPGEFPVRVTKFVPDQRIELRWDAEGGDYQTDVVMTFEAIDVDHTLVRIAEGGWRPDPKGLKASYGNCFGWTQMLCCLKCHVERGFNLREGFF